MTQYHLGLCRIGCGTTIIDLREDSQMIRSDSKITDATVQSANSRHRERVTRDVADFGDRGNGVALFNANNRRSSNVPIRYRASSSK
jgi:hypothetical protein